ncbi:hypothetical protein [Chryseobacterium sp. OSA05B]|uniref:hypothetical protein n=1 Tax=Chryseobacterium sp. OSA05B TaxID=2862650 RepID=UPI001CC119BA|nr:hypothetical protein [Chryseobacterium sp. OSA05B]
MKKNLITAVIMALGTVTQAHAQQKNTGNKAAVEQNAVRQSKDIEKAKNWIIYVVASTLNKANGLAENTNEEAEGKHKEIYTDKYMAYKNDAIEVGMEWKMTLKEFKKKWAKDFNCEYAGIGTGYLVSNGEYGFIEVTRCIFKEKIGNSYLFETIITDTEAKINYKREIRVVPSGNAFLIEDVLEYK